MNGGAIKCKFIIDDISVNKTFKNGPIVYRLGQLVFINKEFDSPWDRQNFKNLYKHY